MGVACCIYAARAGGGGGGWRAAGTSSRRREMVGRRVIAPRSLGIRIRMRTAMGAARREAREGRDPVCLAPCRRRGDLGSRGKRAGFGWDGRHVTGVGGWVVGGHGDTGGHRTPTRSVRGYELRPVFGSYSSWHDGSGRVWGIGDWGEP